MAAGREPSGRWRRPSRAGWRVGEQADPGRARGGPPGRGRVGDDERSEVTRAYWAAMTPEQRAEHGLPETGWGRALFGDAWGDDPRDGSGAS